MSTKTSKPKTISTNGTAAKNGSSSNGNVPKPAKSKKSINQRWIEKYGIDDSEAAKALTRAWDYSFRNRKKRIA